MMGQTRKVRRYLKKAARRGESSRDSNRVENTVRRMLGKIREEGVNGKRKSDISGK